MPMLNRLEIRDTSAEGLTLTTDLAEVIVADAPGLDGDTPGRSQGIQEGVRYLPKEH